MTALSLADKTVLVIGGSRGIGAAVVRRLADEGAAVAFTYAKAQAPADALALDITAKGGRALAIQADSADAAALTAAIDRAAAALGGTIDILVNNAGILVLGQLDDFSLEDFDRSWAVNVRGLFVAVKAAVKHMRRGARILVIGSMTSGRAGAPGSTVYGMTKAAVKRMVRGLTWDLAARGIAINNVEPGPTVTDMNPAGGPHEDWLIKANPQGRLAEASEIADLVAYLAGPGATRINGASLIIDGGMVA
jgi:3-oxoacyl-[acyl-carrier protein] reductase